MGLNIFYNLLIGNRETVFEGAETFQKLFVEGSGDRMGKILGFVIMGLPTLALIVMMFLMPIIAR